ncbi:MAG: primosomal protein, partial [Candidatus Neomarinimicrobiota bacterium]|nr:primosomal protein [Candidatus Neomarinimicrobiota bacterium]
MKLITEINEDLEYIVEGTGDSKSMYINGVFMMSETKNRNGRIYSKPILFNEVNRYRTEYVDKNRAFGELGHPEGPTINLERVSHMIKELKEDGNNIVGKAKIMDTPYGNIVKNLINEGAKLGVSSRGMGSLEEKGGANYVKDDFYLATAADIVADPSAPDAFVDGIMEGKEW